MKQKLIIGLFAVFAIACSGAVKIDDLPLPPSPPHPKFGKPPAARTASFTPAAVDIGDFKLGSVVQFGGPDGNDAIKAIAIDRKSNIVAVGQADLRPFIVRRSTQGANLWQWEPPGPGGGTVTAVATDTNCNIYVTGNFSGSLDFGGGTLVSSNNTYDIFVAKYSQTGVYQWAKRFGSSVVWSAPSDTGVGIAFDANDNSVVVAGVFDNNVNFGGGVLTSIMPAPGVDAFLVKFKADGSHVWSRRIGGANGTAARALAMDRTGNIFLTGAFSSPVNFGAGVVTNNGAFTDVFLAKYDPKGTNLWVRHYGAPTTLCDAWSVAVAPDGSPVVGWHTQGENTFGGALLPAIGARDIILAKYTTAGNHVWSHHYGSANSDVPAVPGLSVDSTGTVMASGVIGRPADFGGGILTGAAGLNCFIAAYAVDGSHVWSKLVGSGAANGCAVATAGAGRFFVGGSFGRTVDFGGQSLTAQVGNRAMDAFLASYSTDPPPAVAVTNRTPMTISPLGGSVMLVSANQAAGARLVMTHADTLPATVWAPLGSFGPGTTEETYSVEIPAHWASPDGQERFFVKGENIYDSAAMLRTLPLVETDTGRTITNRGKILHLWLIGGLHSEFKQYHLKP